MQNAEEIYKRLIINAARAWGHTPEEMDEEGFDPLVSIMLGGVSKELEKAYQELADSKARIVTDLAAHLTPDVLINVLPAHGIMHAQPVEATDMALMTAQFTANTNAVGENEQAVFAPVNDFDIVQANVKYFAHDHILYEQNLHKKEPMLKSPGKNKLPANEIWLGIDVNNKIQNLNGFRFFIDWPFDPNKPIYLEYLQMTKWFYGDMELNMKVGLSEYKPEKLQHNYEKPSYIDQVRKEVISRYSAHFMEVEMEAEKLFGNSKALKKPIPLEDIFGQKEIKAIKGNIIWVKVIFPQLLSHKSLQFLNCNLNCFPVINCKYYSRNISLKVRKTFFSLQCEGEFLSIISIADKNNEPVIDQRTIQGDDTNAVTYLIKDKGIQRFDSRDAKETLEYLFSVLRDESFAFDKYKVNIQSAALKDLRQQVNALSEELKKVNKKKLNDNPFLIFQSKEFPQFIRVEYCATLGELANKIPVGTKLNVLKGILVDSNSLAFLTSTWGGRSYVEDEDKIRMFKHALLSRDSLVTKMDIIAYCKAKIGPILNNVSIEHGSEISLKENEGIIRTLIIVLSLKSDFDLDANELIYLKNDLKNEIESRSCFMYPIRINIV